jgi:hypothetical protein
MGRETSSSQSELNHRHIFTNKTKNTKKHKKNFYFYFDEKRLKFFTSLHFISLYFTLFHFTLLYFTLFHFTLLYFTLILFTLFHFTSLHFTSLFFISLYFISLHFISLLNYPKVNKRENREFFCIF